MSRYCYDIDEMLLCDGHVMGSDEIIAALEERDELADQITELPVGMAIVPREITAETGHKAGMMGEFFERIADTCPQCEGSGRHDASDCDLCDCMGEVTRDVGVSWTTIKAIHKRIVEIAEAAE